MEKILVLVFKKSTGSTFNYNIPYPDSLVEAEQVKSLAQVMITNNVFVFSDGATLSALDSAYIKETNKNPISIA